MTSEEWISVLSQVDEKDLVVIPRGSRISTDYLQEQIGLLKSSMQIDTVIVPTRGTGECGYDNVISFANAVCDKGVLISEEAQIRVLE